VTDPLVRLLGWRALLTHGDPCVLDRWLWARRWMLSGPIRTMDAGSGNGVFAAYAATRGNTVVACSFAESEQAETRRRMRVLDLSQVDVRVLDLRELEQHASELGTFDQILCLETLEHIVADQQVVEQLAQLLSPGGRLIVSVPFAEHRPLYLETLSQVEDGGHVRWGYSEARLRELLVAAGLEPTPAVPVSGWVSQRTTNLMRRLGRWNRIAAWVAVAPLRLLVPLDRPLTRALRHPSLSLGIVGLKPATQD
jgi:2-polyprenyl-3-methyl-5-hydroxy-6-metoxy-1,4-benzoquinol methylase